MAVLPFAVSALAVLTLLVSAALFVGALLWVIRPGGIPLLASLTPREWRLRQARQALKEGRWREAFATAGRLRATAPPAWIARLAHFEGECLCRAAECALRGGQYRDALEFMRGAGDRLGLPEHEFDRRVVDLILAEVRRRVSADPAADAVPHLCGEALRVMPGEPEASFWLGLHHLHRGQAEPARAALQQALADPRVADGPLYMGVLLVRTGHVREGLRWLSQAARLAPECPVVQWQLGEVVLQSGGDPATAVKALEWAAGPNGFARYAAAPHKIWSGMPRSWLAAVARRSPVPCPFGLDQPNFAQVAARRSLAAALARADRFADAANVYYQAVAGGDDAPEVRRGLGLALARAGLYDDARPHLESAWRSEDPPHAPTVGYLALCTARAAAPTAEHRAANLAAAVELMAAVERPADPEWVRLTRELFRDACMAGVHLAPRVLDVLARGFATNDATDPTAVDVYDRLAAAGADLPFDVALTYVRAAVERGARAPRDAALFDRAFAERDALRRTFVDRGWDFAAAERTYLTRWAEGHDGRYPDAPGPIYAAVAEAFLISESRRHAAEGQPEAAGAVLALARRLGPNRPLTLDRLAELADRHGDPDAALELLRTWERLHPADVRPPTRAALIDLREGRVDEALAWLAESTSRATGPARVRLLLLTARVALAAGQPKAADELVGQARQLAPADAEPLLLDAALAWQRRDTGRLARLAGPLRQVAGDDAVRTLLAAVAAFAAGDGAAAHAAAESAAASPPVSAEAAYLRALLLAGQGQVVEARAALVPAEGGRTAAGAHALAARLDWEGGKYDAARSALRAIPAERRRAWGLDRPAGAAAFLAAAAELRAGRYSKALKLFREAREGGLEHERLGVWEAVAGQRAPANEAEDPDAAIPLARVEALLGADGLSPANRAWLARGYRRAGALDEARRLLVVADGPEFHWQMQRGLLALREGRLADAEANFAAAARLEPANAAAAYDLAMTRLSLGRSAAGDLRRAAELQTAPEPTWLLGALLDLLAEPFEPAGLARLDDAAVHRLVRGIQRLGRLEVAAEFVRRLLVAQPKHETVLQAATDVNVLAVKAWIDRGEPARALAAVPATAAGLPAALHNLLGVAADLTGDRSAAVQHFNAAIPGAGDDARVQHNLALAYTRLGRPDRAQVHWRRCLANVLNHGLAPPDDAAYLDRLVDAIGDRVSTPRELVGSAP
jgi:tetratricopeptide (TPR) repeat protein